MPSKRFAQAATLVDQKVIYPLDKAVDVLRQFPPTKFNETVEIAFHLGVDPRHAEQMVRGSVTLPHGTGKNVRVVSMPSTDVFDAQDAAYRESVLPKVITRRVAVEAGVTDGWYKYVGLNGKIVGLNRFGESAPGGVLFKYFGFTGENVAVCGGVVDRAAGQIRPHIQSRPPFQPFKPGYLTRL